MFLYEVDYIKKVENAETGQLVPHDPKTYQVLAENPLTAAANLGRIYHKDDYEIEIVCVREIKYAW